MKTSARHLIPDDDWWPHVEDEDCMCGPSKFVITDLNGNRQRIAQHHTLRPPREDEVA